MQRDIGRIAYHPTIVSGRAGRDVKDHAGTEFVDGAVFHCSRRTTGEHQPNMLDVAERRPHAGADVNRPLPSGLVGGASDRHSSDANQFESSLFKHTHFVWRFKALQYCIKHRHTPSPAGYSETEVRNSR